jgi:aspartyl-tRNA(Asn)/glutamyl-tRNA(Gln) amidotransferase subunit A
MTHAVPFDCPTRRRRGQAVAAVDDALANAPRGTAASSRFHESFPARGGRRAGAVVNRRARRDRGGDRGRGAGGQVARARRRRAVPRSDRAARRRARLLSAGRRRGRARRADAVDAARKAGRDPGALAGVPLGVKDIFCTRGVETTCASKILRGFVPPTNRRSPERLAAAGGVMLGKLNMDEFAMGSSNENSAFKPVSNPWSLAHVPGGSSGGSAAAIARRCAPDRSAPTRAARSGSRPRCAASSASSRPTAGCRAYGVIAFASSLDHPGPFGRTVEDAAALLEVMAGADPHDATSIPTPVGQYRAAARAGREGPEPLKGMPAWRSRRILSARHGRRGRGRGARGDRRAVARGRAHRQGVAAEHEIRDRDLLSRLHRGGVVEPGALRRRSSRISRADARSLEEMYTKTRGEGFGAEPKRRIMLGTYVLRAGYYEAYYGKALRARRKIADDFTAAFAAATRSSPRRRRCRRSSSANAWAIRCRCTSPTC